MTNRDRDDEICLRCGAILQCRVDRATLFGMPVPTKREYCEVCCYLENVRLFALCKCPYKEPMPRLGLDGKVPQSVYDKIEKLRQDLAGMKLLF